MYLCIYVLYCIVLYCIVLYCIAWYGMVCMLLVCCNSPSKLWRLQITGGPGFEDVDDIGASTFESWDWSVQFGVTALVLWLLGSRKEAWTTLAFDTSRHHHPLRPCSLRVLSWLFAWATLPPCLCKAAAVMMTLYQLRPRMATPRLWQRQWPRRPPRETPWLRQPPWPWRRRWPAPWQRRWPAPWQRRWPAPWPLQTPQRSPHENKPLSFAINSHFSQHLSQDQLANSQVLYLWGLRLTAGRRQKQTRQPELVVLLLLLLLADVGPMLAQACPYLSLMLTHVAHILADVGPMWAPRPSRCPVFRSGPLPKTQNHEKPIVF